MVMTQGYQLDQSLSLRLIKIVLDDVLLEHGGLPCVLPFAVHLDWGAGESFLTLRGTWGFYLLKIIGWVTGRPSPGPSPMSPKVKSKVRKSEFGIREGLKKKSYGMFLKGGGGPSDFGSVSITFYIFKHVLNHPEMQRHFFSPTGTNFDKIQKFLCPSDRELPRDYFGH